MCGPITNINVTKVMDAFGLTDLVNPLEVHIGYDRDDRGHLLQKVTRCGSLVQQRWVFVDEV